MTDATSGRPAPAAESGPLDAALAYLEAGLSVIPIRRDGSKAPDTDLLPLAEGDDGKLRPVWDPYKEQPPSPAEVQDWFGRPSPPGVAVVCGVAGLMVLDVEFTDFWEEFAALVEAERPGLLARLPLVRTPGKDANGGRHLYFRSPAPGRSRKLARLTEAEAARRTGDPKRTTAIEVKGQGGYVLAPGCPAACHPSGRLYEHLGGPPIAQTPAIAGEDVQALLQAAAALTRQGPAPEDRRPSSRPGPPRPADGAGGRPGDHFSREVDWRAVLLPHGWAVVRQRGEVAYWRRPGKDRGISATTGHCTSEAGGSLLYVFSSNAAPFEEERAYSKFAAFCLLNHGGDFAAAAKELAARGFGEQRPTGRAAAPPHPAGPTPAPKPGIWLGPLELFPGLARRTDSGRVSLPLTVRRKGDLVEELFLSSAPTARQTAERRLRELLRADAPTNATAKDLAKVAAENRVKVSEVVGEVLARAGQAADQAAQLPPDVSGPTLVQLVARLVPGRLRLTFRTDTGLWSEVERRELTYGELRSRVPSWLLSAAAEACPARGGDALALLHQIQAALSVLYHDRRERLPREADADLGDDSARAEQWRAALMRLWSATDTWDRPADPATPASRTSLARRALDDCRAAGSRTRGGWQRVISGVSAWWRAAPEDGRPRLLLAMRYALCDQVQGGRIRLPGVTDERSLTLLGCRYGGLQPDPPVWARVRADGAPVRVAVLAPRVTAELLYDPRDTPDEGGGGVCAEGAAHTDGVCAQPPLRTHDLREEG